MPAMAVAITPIAIPAIAPGESMGGAVVSGVLVAVVAVRPVFDIDVAGGTVSEVVEGGRIAGEEVGGSSAVISRQFRYPYF